MEQAEQLKELTEFAQITAQVLQDHKEVLERHEENFLGAYRSSESHKTVIEQLQQTVQHLSVLVNEQNLVLVHLQKILRRVMSNIGMTESGSDGDKIN